jgi:hypothetical protein
MNDEQGPAFIVHPSSFIVRNPASGAKPMNEQPPILHTWPRLYGAVLGMLVLEVILFTILTRSFQ